MTWRRERVAYVVIGLGFGALVDGFVLHQLLQWHHLVSAKTTVETVSGLEENTLADGIFHTASLAVLALGVGLLVGRRCEALPLVGLALVGWGAFNVVDQLVFHLAFGAHHIREGVENYQAYDWGFFGLGLLLVALGVAVLRVAGRRASAKTQESPSS
ncbi:MAG: DUF2243 domain-containing protein [Actinomycetota bacterium]|nr:DUF2243 domain-containing protein [Actinomycetota bacterium]